MLPMPFIWLIPWPLIFKDIIAADHLRHLEMYIADEKHGKSLNELYEIVQYAGNILPRL